jgi:hypothetical protein
MNRTSCLNYAVLGAALPLAISFFATQNQTTPSPKDQPIRTVIDLVTFNVTVQDQETGKPIEDLGYEDFQVFDNGHPVEPRIFESGRSPGPRPLTMWFLVSCPKQKGVESGSPFGAGNGRVFGPALENLNSDYSMGVAHWCDNGDAKIDLAPTQKQDAPLAAIDAVLHRAPVKVDKNLGKLALQRTLDLVVDSTRSENQFALPVIVLQYDGTMGMTKDEADLLAKRLLYKGVIVYQVTDHREHFAASNSGGKESSLKFISAQTGGRAIVVQHADYQGAINSIFQLLRFRYTLGISPPSRDRQWHELRVKLTEAALRKHKHARVDCGAGYLAGGSFGSVPPYSISQYRQAANSQLDPNLTHAIDSSTLTRDVRFGAKAHGFVGSNKLAEFTLSLDSDQVTWATLPNGDRQSEISIVVASFSEEGKRIGHEAVQFELTRDEIHLPITGDGPFVHSETVILPESASSVRLVVLDAATGRLGVRDFSLKEILDAPRSPSVIR